MKRQQWAYVFVSCILVSVLVMLWRLRVVYMDQIVSQDFSLLKQTLIHEAYGSAANTDETKSFLSPCSNRALSFLEEKGNGGIVIGYRWNIDRNSQGKGKGNGIDVPFLYAPAAFVSSKHRDNLYESGFTKSKRELPVTMMLSLPTRKQLAAESAATSETAEEAAANYVYIDVGANNGLTSLPIAASSAHQFEVHAFEPVKQMVDLLCISSRLGDYQFEKRSGFGGSSNSNRNSNSRLHIIEAALSDQPNAPHANIHLPKNKHFDNAAFGGGGGVAEARMGGGKGSVGGELASVQLLTVDEYLAVHARHVSQVVLMKVDVQGHEYNVLRGAVRSIARRAITAILTEHDQLLLNAATAINDGGSNRGDVDAATFSKPHHESLLQFFQAQNWSAYPASQFSVMKKKKQKAAAANGGAKYFFGVQKGTLRLQELDKNKPIEVLWSPDDEEEQ